MSKKASDQLQAYVSVIPEREVVENVLKGLLPETLDLHSLLGHQLHAVMVSGSQILQENRDTFQSLIESIFVKQMISIIKKNGDGQFLEIITQKVKDLFVSNPNNSNRIVKTLLRDILGIQSKNDLAGIPVDLLDPVHKLLKKQLRLQFFPLIMPIIEREKDRNKLNQMSGSSFLGDLCGAVAKDVIAFGPSAAISSQEVAKKVVAGMIPSVKEAVQEELSKQLHTFIHANNPAFQNVSQVAQQYLEDVLLKVFIKITEKNPPKEGKDVLVVLTENLVNLVKTKYKALNDQPVDKVVQSLTDDIMNNVLGIDSEEPFRGIPKALQAIACRMLKEHISGHIESSYQHLQTLNSNNDKIKDVKEGLKAILGSTCAETVLKDTGDEAMTSTLHTLDEVVGVQPKGVTLITEAAYKLRSFCER